MVRRAVNESYVLVTHNGMDSVRLIERESCHAGLVCLKVAHGLMGLEVQRFLFDYALTEIGETDLTGQVVEIELTAARTVRMERYPTESG